MANIHAPRAIVTLYPPAFGRRLRLCRHLVASFIFLMVLATGLAPLHAMALRKSPAPAPPPEGSPASATIQAPAVSARAYGAPDGPARSQAPRLSEDDAPQALRGPATTPATARLLAISRDARILAALKLIESLPLDWARPVLNAPALHINFGDLSRFGPGYANYDALSWLTPGTTTWTDEMEHPEHRPTRLFIYLNPKHANAPPEALAALIAHEALHADAYNSVTEEINGWAREARVWRMLASPALKAAAASASNQPKKTGGLFGRLFATADTSEALLYRLNKISNADCAGTLRELVSQNPAYKTLPETSPGFTTPPGPPTGCPGN